MQCLSVHNYRARKKKTLTARQATLIAHLTTQSLRIKPHFNPILKGKLDFRFYSTPVISKIKLSAHYTVLTSTKSCSIHHDMHNEYNTSNCIKQLFHVLNLFM